MNLREALLQEFDLELPFTRRSLERVPIEKFDWKPHDKSMTLGWLATFIAISPTWGVFTLEQDVFDVKAGSSGQRPSLPKTQAELLQLFDQNYGKLRTVLAAASDASLEQPWSLKSGDEVWFTQPRWLALREFILNHIIHHRAQLGVYLRLLDISVPAIYNDSADEKGGVFMDGGTRPRPSS
ncbi:MAG TPA: DinB family protein [Vicinamibacterales bacterium]|nr:DinB family protein [Vicinamibacterales bacterium]